MRKSAHRAILNAMSTQRYERIPVFTPGDRLKKAREFRGMSQDELAEATGISRSTVSHLELDKAPLKASYLKLWSLATGVPVKWLESGESPAGSGDGVSMGTHRYTHSPAA